MTLSIRSYVINPTLTACRVVSTANLNGNYFNGQTNNGVGATLTSTIAAALVVDGVTLEIGNRILLVGQTASSQNGIYTITNPGSASISWVLTRAQDFQNIEQLQEGQYVSIAAGTVNGGAVYTLVEPLPEQFGLSPIGFDSSTNQIAQALGTAAFKNASNNADPRLASVTGAYVIGDIATFSDVNGSLADSGITPSNPGLPEVASVSGATVAGDFLIAADAAGTVADGGAALHAIGAFTIPGGGTSYSIPIPGLTAAAVAIITPRFLGNPAYLVQCISGTDSLSIAFNTDPGVSTLNIFYSTASF
jgi:hypothetical protein